MNANSSLNQMVFPGWEHMILPSVKANVKHCESGVDCARITDLCLELGIPVLVPRRRTCLGWCLELPDSLVFGAYGFDFLHPSATFRTRPLDNPPIIADASVTTVDEAFRTMENVWRDKILAPLDLFAFSMLVNDQDSGGSFFEMITKMYNAYNKVIVLFADDVSVESPCSKKHFFILEVVFQKKKIQSFCFKTVLGNASFYLSHRETIVAVCVPQDKVIPTPEVENLIPSEAVPLVCGVDQGISVPNRQDLEQDGPVLTLRQQIAMLEESERSRT